MRWGFVEVGPGQILFDLVRGIEIVPNQGESGSGAFREARMGSSRFHPGTG